MMKRISILIFVVVVLMACSFIRTPDDFPPPPPQTPIEEWPQLTPTVTLEPRLRGILPSDMQEAETFFLIVKTSMAAGDDVGIAARVQYPIRVKTNGQEISLKNKQEFLEQYEKIFDESFVNILSDIDESDLTLLPNGIKVGNGELWLNYFCVDSACSDAHFLITQINK
jgi:hypothetical protein